MAWIAKFPASDVRLAKIWPFWSITLLVYLVQNVLTSGLIVFKIWSQCRRARETRMRSLFSPDLHAVMRMVIESAAIYTTLMATALVLLFMEHPMRFMVYMIQTPLTGTSVLFRMNKILTKTRHCIRPFGRSGARRSERCS